VASASRDLHSSPTRRSSDLGPVMQVIIMLAIIASLKGYESIMVMTEGGPIGKTEVMYLYLYKLLFPVSTACRDTGTSLPSCRSRSEEHTSELQSRETVVCRL